MVDKRYMTHVLEMDLIAKGAQIRAEPAYYGFRHGHIRIHCYLTSKNKFSVGHDGQLKIDLTSFGRVFNRKSFDLMLHPKKIEDYTGIDFWIDTKKEIMRCWNEKQKPETYVGFIGPKWKQFCEKKLSEIGGNKYRLNFTNTLISNIHQKMNVQEFAGMPKVSGGELGPRMWINIKTFRVIEKDRPLDLGGPVGDEIWTTSSDEPRFHHF